ncbi:MAG TPA: hypothetical protein VGF93_00335 [Solirubrobacteraceae bacterium]
MRRVLVAFAAVLVLAPVARAAAQPPAPPFPDARLQGSFDLAGRVTAAHAVKGEHVGETVDRVWSFASSCPVGQCPEVTLTRARANASDTLVLHRRGPGTYAGTGSFVAPLRCAGRLYPAGEKVPFTITVKVTFAVPFGGATFATRVSATYRNRKRLNRTPCVGALGHDAANYHGHLEAAAGPAPGA